jgi:hypothetical protein
MRYIAGVGMLAVTWLIGMSTLMIGLDDLLFGARLNALFLWSGAVVASTITAELAEEAGEWMGQNTKSTSDLGEASAPRPTPR